MQYDDLVNDVVLDCQGIPTPIVIRAITESVRTFCRESTAYRTILPSSSLAYSDGIYTIETPIDTLIETIVSPIVFNGNVVYSFTNNYFSGLTYSNSNSVPLAGYSLTSTNYYHNNKPIEGKSPEWLDLNIAGWRTNTSSDKVDYFVMKSTNTFTLIPDDGIDKSSILSVSLVLMPDRATTMLDDEFGTRWFDYLVAGAKYFAMMTPGAEWTNPELAMFYKAKFDDGIQIAKSYIRTGLRNPKADGVRHVRLHYR